jgi:hypothetical protein
MKKNTKIMIGLLSLFMVLTLCSVSASYLDNVIEGLKNSDIMGGKTISSDIPEKQTTTNLNDLESVLNILKQNEKAKQIFALSGYNNACLIIGNEKYTIDKNFNLLNSNQVLCSGIKIKVNENLPKEELKTKIYTQDLKGTNKILKDNIKVNWSVKLMMWYKCQKYKDVCNLDNVQI